MPITPKGMRMRADQQTVGPTPHAGHLTDRVGEGGHFAQAVGHRPHPLRIESQAIEHRRGQPGFAGGGEILFVGGKDDVGLFDQGGGHALQQVVLHCGGEAGQDLSGGPCILGDLGHLFG